MRKKIKEEDKKNETCDTGETLRLRQNKNRVDRMLKGCRGEENG